MAGIDKDVVRRDSGRLFDLLSRLVQVIAIDHQDVDGHDAQLDIALNHNGCGLQLTFLSFHKAGTNAAPDDHRVFGHHF